MSYRPCPNCRASNRASDPVCYSCGESMVVEPKPDIVGSPQGTGSIKVSSSASDTGYGVLMALAALGLMTGFGGLLGFAWDALEVELPFFLEELLLGVLCAVVGVQLIGKFQDMPVGLIAPRLWRAAAFGAIVGFDLFAIWWSFDPAFESVGIGAIAGFCSGLPVVVSFGLLGGSSRPLGRLEFLNLAAGMAMGAVLGIFIGLEDEDFSMVPGLMGMVGLIPTLAGGRINLYDVLVQLSKNSD